MNPIGYDVQPDDGGIPFVAHAVRHEPVGGKEALDETHVGKAYTESHEMLDTAKSLVMLAPQ